MAEASTETRSHLCVGGPLAGKRYAILHGDRFRIAEWLDTDPSLRWDARAKHEVKHIEYRREEFAGVSFFVPTDQTAHETMKLLLTAYERATS